MNENFLYVVFALATFSMGASVGSFLNVVAHRLPRGISVILPRSHCPQCQAVIGPLALLPIVGYFFVRGRCASCGTRISARYPTVEFLVALGTTALFFFHLDPIFMLGDLFPASGFPSLVSSSLFSKYLPLFTGLWLFYSAVTLSLIDFDFRILPDKITLPGILVGLCLSAASPGKGWLFGVWGAALGGGVLYAIAVLYRLLRKQEGMGFGDVKYLACLGSCLGSEGVFVTLAVASILGAFFGVIVGIVTKKGLQASIPFGPFLALGGLIYHLSSAPALGPLQQFFHRSFLK